MVLACFFCTSIFTSALVLREQNLTHVPTVLPPEDTVLDLAINRLTIIRTDVFSAMENLTRLVLNRNQIHTFENGAFNGLWRLQYLDIEHNKLRYIPNFSQLQILQALLLGINPLSSIKTEGLQNIKHLKHLRHLQIRWTGVGYFPPFPQFPNMQKIQLRGNILRRLLPGHLKGMPTLEYIWLGYNRLTSFLGSGYLMEKLKMLDLRDNMIYCIPDLSNYPNLVRLDLSNNYISAVPEASLLPMASGMVVLEGNAIPCVQGLCWLITSSTAVTVKLICPDGRSWTELDRDVICEGGYSNIAPK